MDVSDLDNVIVTEPGDFAQTAAEVIVNRMVSALNETDVIELCLPGGDLMGPVYDRLAPEAETRAHCFPWGDVRIAFAVEPWVWWERPESAYGLMRKRLLSQLEIKPFMIWNPRVLDGDPDHVARMYAGGLRTPDVLVLTLGEDGAIAGLFPDSPALDERARAAVAVESPAGRRITVTPPVISAAKRVVVLAAGAGASLQVHAALRNDLPLHQCPAGMVKHATWIVDPAAAMLLGRV